MAQKKAKIVRLDPSELLKDMPDELKQLLTKEAEERPPIEDTLAKANAALKAAQRLKTKTAMVCPICGEEDCTWPEDTGEARIPKDEYHDGGDDDE